MCCGLVESAAFWRRLSPGKNPPLMLEHLGFHPSSLPPLLSSSLPPSFSCLYISLHRACCFGPGDFFFYPSIQCIWRATHRISKPEERKTQRAEPLPPPAPVHTGRAHAPDPAHPRNRPTGSACLSVQRLTNKPPSTVCSVSHPTSPSISITPLL